jgi:hypothetical protein
LLDCSYAQFSSPRAAQDISDLHITLVVPGQVERCTELDTRRRGCITGMQADEPAEPVSYYVAEQVNYGTAILGFRLQLDEAGIRDAAAAHGFDCKEEEFLRCRRGKTEMKFQLDQGKLVKIEQISKGSAQEIDLLHRQAVFRFGLARTYVDGGKLEIWKSMIAPVWLSMSWRGQMFTQTLAIER